MLSPTSYPTKGPTLPTCNYIAKHLAAQVTCVQLGKRTLLSVYPARVETWLSDKGLLTHTEILR
jgi:hypothetical protein